MRNRDAYLLLNNALMTEANSVKLDTPLAGDPKYHKCRERYTGKTAKRSKYLNILIFTQ